MILQTKRVGVFVMGGIAAYKVPELVRQLIKKGAHVRVAMTKAATEFVTPMTLQVLTKERVLVDTFDEQVPSEVQHVALADWCDVALVVPATANGLAKMVHGIADDVVTTTLLATSCPRLIVPAMNVHMYENPATQRNIQQLRQDGYVVMEPDTGFLAEGYEGKGRLPELHRIVAQLESVVAAKTLPQVLAGKRVVISAGGTKERIDPVRYISNDSSGKMGYALAQAAQWLGAQVTLVSAVRNLVAPEGVQVRYIQSALELQEAVNIEFERCDYVAMAAAVSDYRVMQQANQKIKKQAGQTGLTLELVENPDILAGLGASKTHQVVIGFAAETEKLAEYAKRKLARKKADWIIANDVSQAGIGFNSDQNQVVLFGCEGQEIAFPQLAKVELAVQLWQAIVKG